MIALVESGAALEPLGISTDLLPARADDVFLSFVDGGQLVGLKGTLSWNGQSLRFQVADGVHMRRNRYTRVDAELAVTLRRGDETYEGVTVNVAPEGLLVKAPLRRARRRRRRRARPPRPAAPAAVAGRGRPPAAA